MFTLKDIEESLAMFSGTDNVQVQLWLEDFEDNAETLGWNELQKFIYCKELLTGAAHMFIHSQSGIKSFNLLKESLRREFGTRLSCAEVHRFLEARKKKQSESFREYLYVLLEFGKSIKLDDESLIQYYVDGISDTKFGKSILYQAKDIEDLKEKLKVYEKIRGPTSHTADPRVLSDYYKMDNEKPSAPTQRKCYKCGGSGHLAKGCRDKSIKCFKCGEIGHKANECKCPQQPKLSWNSQIHA